MSALANGFEVWRRRWKLQRILKAARGGRIILSDRPAGFFSIYFQVLGALEIATALPASLMLRFHRAAYSTADTGAAGWWPDYFEQDNFGTPALDGTPELRITTDENLCKITHLGNRLSRARAHRWTCLLRPRPHITRAVEAFANHNFGTARIIGVHYRGTDKVTGNKREAERVDPNAIVQLLTHVPSDCKIFVATDELSFLQLMQERFPSRTIATPARRSLDGTPLHLPGGEANPQDLGKEALLDALLLARTDLLLRTESNLSQASACMNLRLPIFNLTAQARLIATDPDQAARCIIREVSQIRDRQTNLSHSSHAT